MAKMRPGPHGLASWFKYDRPSIIFGMNIVAKMRPMILAWVGKITKTRPEIILNSKKKILNKRFLSCSTSNYRRQKFS